MRNGFGWFTCGNSLTVRVRERGLRKGMRTPKRYPAVAPFTPQEQLVIAQLQAARLAQDGLR